jgi:hypothetical protein
MKTKILLLIAVLFLSISLVSANYDIKINMKNIFMEKEKIFFNYTIKLDYAGEISYSPGIACTGKPDSLLELKKANLVWGEDFTGFYESKSSENLYGNCYAYVSLLSPFNTVAKKNFIIISPQDLSLTINSCKDKSCLEKSNIFLKNQDIYLDYESNVDNPAIKATLTSPSGKKTSSINIPGKLNLAETGTYTINAEASKEGYKTAQISKQIAIIEKEARITANAPAAFAETVKPGAESESIVQKSSFPWIAAIIIVIIAILIAIIILLQLYRKRNF